MKKRILTLFVLISSTFGYGQIDTIYTLNEIIPCNVKEITPDLVKYIFSGEDVLNSIYNSTVYKIVFKNGRVQTFVDPLSNNEVKGGNDFNKVSITSIEFEIEDLIKLGEVEANAKGKTVVSKQHQVKMRAFRKMKILAAMMGGNTIYIRKPHDEHSLFRTELKSPKRNKGNIVGVVYTNRIPDIDLFKKLVQEKSLVNATLSSVDEIQLRSNTTTLDRFKNNRNLTILNVKYENGYIYLQGDLENEVSIRNYRVVSFDEEFITVYFVSNNTAINLKLKY